MKRDSNRIDRISDLIQNALAQIIHQMDDPRIGMITIEQVKISKDLSQAKVYVSTLDPEKGPQTITTLNRASGFLRTQLGQKVKLRIVPHLVFYYDETMVKAEKLSKLIHDVLKQDKSSDKSPGEES
jgi:ribosome-binding factor A